MLEGRGVILPAEASQGSQSAGTRGQTESNKEGQKEVLRHPQKGRAGGEDTSDKAGVKEKGGHGSSASMGSLSQLAPATRVRVVRAYGGETVRVLYPVAARVPYLSVPRATSERGFASPCGVALLRDSIVGLACRRAAYRRQGAKWGDHVLPARVVLPSARRLPEANLVPQALTRGAHESSLLERRLTCMFFPESRLVGR